MTSAEWEEVDAAIRQHYFWSAQQTQLDAVQKMQELVAKSLTMATGEGEATMDKSKFIADMREYLGSPAGDSGELTDINSRKRLGLIYDFNREQANEYGRAKVGNTPAILRAFPCQELVRVMSRRVPRDWQSRWVEAGGSLYGGRMIARKDDPIWADISRFSTPYPPFDYQSGMGVRDVGRREAIRLGVIEADENVTPSNISLPSAISE